MSLIPPLHSQSNVHTFNFDFTCHFTSHPSDQVTTNGNHILMDGQMQSWRFEQKKISQLWISSFIYRHFSFHTNDKVLFINKNSNLNSPFFFFHPSILFITSLNALLNGTITQTFALILCCYTCPNQLIVKTSSRTGPIIYAGQMNVKNLNLHNSIPRPYW